MLRNGASWEAAAPSSRPRTHLQSLFLVRFPGREQKSSISGHPTHARTDSGDSNTKRVEGWVGEEGLLDVAW